MKILLLLLLYFNPSFSQAYSSCCLNPSLFPELLHFFSCDHICASQNQSAESLCISCLENAIKTFTFTVEESNASSSEPTIICQSVKWMNKTAYGKVVLNWSPPPVETLTAFIIETRSSYLDQWHLIGLTNQSLIHIDDLTPGQEYQFRITPFNQPDMLLPSLISNWTMVLGSKSSLVAPSVSFNVAVNSFTLNNNSLDATVEWIAAEDIPCSYIIYWFPSSFDGSFYDKTVELSDRNRSTVLSGLFFKTKYIVKIAAFHPNHSHPVQFETLTFITPSCLNLTRGNFTLCVPGSPLNLSVMPLPDFKAFLSWIPPLYSSADNPVLGYQISVIEAAEKHYILIRPKESFRVDKDVLNVTVSNLRSQVVYLFHVRAFTVAGVGIPAVALSETSAISSNYQPLEYVPWHYIVPSLVFALVALLAAVIYHFFHLQRIVDKTKGYPSGTADVPEHILPSLLFSSQIQLHEIIGKGEFGVVHRATYCRKKEKETVAVKVFPAESVSRSKLLQEVEILLTVGRHQNVVSFIGFTMDVDKMFLILEYCAIGNLHSWLLKLKKELSVIKGQKFDPNQPLIQNGKSEHYGMRLCSFIHQIALGMSHISSLRLVHRDLAARNVLLCDEKHVKIADFGLSRDIYLTQTYTVMKQKKLPLRWMAPESIEKHIFTIQSDVWSFGVVIWEIFKFGKLPYSSLSNSAILHFLNSGRRLPKPNATSQCWYELMLDCWHIDPHKRPTFEDLVHRTDCILNKLANYTAVINN